MDGAPSISRRSSRSDADGAAAAAARPPARRCVHLQILARSICSIMSCEPACCANHTSSSFLRPACLPACAAPPRSLLSAGPAGRRPPVHRLRPETCTVKGRKPHTSIHHRPHTARRRPPRRDNLSRRNTTTILLLQYILRTNAIAARAGGEDRSTLFFLLAKRYSSRYDQAVKSALVFLVKHRAWQRRWAWATVRPALMGAGMTTGAGQY
jgi:hypothetical protein